MHEKYANFYFRHTLFSQVFIFFQKHLIGVYSIMISQQNEEKLVSSDFMWNLTEELCVENMTSSNVFYRGRV